MKRLLLTLAVVTLVATAASFAVARWMAQRRQPEVRLHDAAWLKQTLNLSDAQAVEIQKLETQFQSTLQTCCDNHCNARFALTEELARPSVAKETATACVERMNTAQAAAERATLDHILRVRAVLNPDQQQRYAKLINQQLCTSCPLGLHHTNP